MIRRGLEQVYLLQPSTDIQTAVNQVVNSHNNSPSRINPKLTDGTHTSPNEVVEDPEISDDMEVIRRQRRQDQYSTNVGKKVMLKKPKYKIGDAVHYLKRRSKFSKEASLTGNWSDKIYQIHSINKAHSFNPMYTYVLSELGTSRRSNVLSELGTSRRSSDLPSIREDFLKVARVNLNDTFIIDKVLQCKGNKLLVKWHDYETPTWEPSFIPKHLHPKKKKTWKVHNQT